jgi:hypothetical protein
MGERLWDELGRFASRRRLSRSRARALASSERARGRRSKRFSRPGRSRDTRNQCEVSTATKDPQT